MVRRLRGKWVLIPPNKIVPDYAPDGRGYLFAVQKLGALVFDDGAPDYAGIMCFVRPRTDY